VVVTERASQLAVRYQVDPRMVQAVLDESVRVIRDDRVLLVENPTTASSVSRRNRQVKRTRLRHRLHCFP